MMGSSQPVAGVGIGDRQGETAATDHDQDGVEHCVLPFQRGGSGHRTSQINMTIARPAATIGCEKPRRYFPQMPDARRIRVTASATAKWTPSTRPISKSTAPGRGNPAIARGSAGGCGHWRVRGAAKSGVGEEEWEDHFMVPGNWTWTP